MDGKKVSGRGEGGAVNEGERRRVEGEEEEEGASLMFFQVTRSSPSSCHFNMHTLSRTLKSNSPSMC